MERNQLLYVFNHAYSIFKIRVLALPPFFSAILLTTSILRPRFLTTSQRAGALREEIYHFPIQTSVQCVCLLVNLHYLSAREIELLNVFTELSLSDQEELLDIANMKMQRAKRLTMRFKEFFKKK